MMLLVATALATGLLVVTAIAALAQSTDGSVSSPIHIL
jgi:hypothetical protein